MVTTCHHSYNFKTEPTGTVMFLINRYRDVISIFEKICFSTYQLEVSEPFSIPLNDQKPSPSTYL